MTAIDLLYDNAETARRILREDKPRMTREQYLGYQRKLDSTELFQP